MNHASQILRYLISGGTAALVHIASTYFFTEYAHFWYVFSVALGFLIAYVVSFILQKFWTFADHSMDRVSSQAGKFLLTGIGGLLTNMAGVYALTEYGGVFYLYSQVIVIGFVALCTFFIYKFIIFTPATVSKDQHDISEPTYKITVE